MAATINLSALTFTADQLRQMNELLVKAVLEAPDLNLFHELATGIKNDREIGIIPGTLGLMGKAAQGCNPTADTLTDTAVLKTWTPKRIEVIIDQCATDIASSMAKLSRKLGIEVNDLTNTEYFAFLLDLLAVDIPKMILRHAWMGNQAAATVTDSPAGVLTTGTDPDYFNVINGFFYQLGVIYAGDATRKTSISANAQATRALQFSAFAASDALAALNSVVDDAKAELAIQPDRVLLVTRSVFQKAYRALQAAGYVYQDIKLQSNGFELGSWDGIPMYSVPLWDAWIESYENNGTKLNNPHRIVYTTKSNLVIGMEGTTLFDNVNTFYDPKSRYNRIEVSDAFDVKVLNDELVQVGI
jgi:hypothetical protein